MWRLNGKGVFVNVEATAWNKLIPCNIFNSLIRYYLLCLLFIVFNEFKSSSKGIYLRIKCNRGVGQCGNCSLKAGNILQNFQITNQILFVIYSSLLILLQVQNIIKVKIFEDWIENEFKPMWNPRPETRDPLVTSSNL